MKKRVVSIGVILCMIFASFAMSGCTGTVDHTQTQSFSIEDIPAYSEDGYVVINDNIPEFPAEDFTMEELKKFRKMNSTTPGHPKLNISKRIECREDY